MRRLIGLCAAVLILSVMAVASPTPALATSAPARPHPHRRPWPITVTVQTAPPLANVRLSFDGTTLTTNAAGRASYTREHNFSKHSLVLVSTSVDLPDRRYRFARWGGQRDPSEAFLPSLTGLPMRTSYTVTAAFTVQYPVTAAFVDQAGQALDPSQISEVKVRSDTGEILDFPKTGTVWLTGSVPSYRDSALVENTVSYSLQSVVISGANIVDAGRQRFTPASAPTVTFTGQLHDLTVSANDAVFRSAIGTGAVVTYPNGTVRTVAFGADHTATLANVPRGTYKVTVAGASGVVMTQQIGLSRDRALTIGVVTRGDLAGLAIAILIIAVVLLLIGRFRRPAMRWLSRAGARLRLLADHQSTRDSRAARLFSMVGGKPGRRGAVVLVVTAMLAAMAPPVASPTPTPSPGASAPAASEPSIPLFAFYYIWFDPSSWDRAKIDYPQLGHYSSDDPRVMRQHIEWAKLAGIDGFIVSWKDTPTNDRRLRLLMDVAGQEHFKLAMIYQGLDFNRNPLPAAQVAADFVTFSTQYANDPVFARLGGKTLTIWSGTWAYTHSQVAQVTGPVRNAMLVLNTEKSTAGYQRISDVTDGDAYYWSSVDADTNSGYSAKLNEMAQAIHRGGKYWIAPFAPGFDARLVGGTNTVDRKDGQTLRTEYTAAVQSSPDALGLISWNEFSENSYVEPSEKFGTRYLDVVRELRTTAVPQPLSAADSSGDAVAATGSQPPRRWQGLVLLGFPLGLVAVMALLANRQRRRRHVSPTNG